MIRRRIPGVGLILTLKRTARTRDRAAWGATDAAVVASLP